MGLPTQLILGGLHEAYEGMKLRTTNVQRYDTSQWRGLALAFESRIEWATGVGNTGRRDRHDA